MTGLGTARRLLMTGAFLATAAAWAQPSAVMTPAASPSRAMDQPLAVTTPEQLKASEDQIKFLAYFLSRLELTNVSPQNELLQGQTIARLFGPNSTQTGQSAFFGEQRFIPFIIFEPKILDGYARLRASFELKWTWGDTSYGVGGNSGSAINARSVNIQTSNLEMELKLPFEGWYANVGLQRLFDNVRDPYRTFFGTLSQTGERLALFSADAVGVSINGRTLENTFRFGAYELYENKIGQDDDVMLFEALADHHLGRTWHVGASARYLRDRSSGAGGVSILGQGLASRLADYNGVYRFPLTSSDPTGVKYHADLAWFALDTSINPEFTADRFGGSAFVVMNVGDVRVEQGAEGFKHAANVIGFAANARAGYRYGTTRNDIIVAEAIFTNGDSNGLDDGTFSGIITGNQYGAPGAAFVGHGAYLLFPQAIVVNRFSAAVQDIGNVGYGLMGGTLNISKDIVPNVFTVKVGAATAASVIAPVGGGSFIGVEVNAMASYRLATFLHLELHTAYLKLGDFFDGPAIATGGRPKDPWTTFLALKWLIF